MKDVFIRMRKLVVILLCLASISGCKPGIPDSIVQPKEMELILYDMHLAEGYIGTLPTSDSARKIGAQFYTGIYRKYHIDSLKYQNSLSYYYKNPALFSKIYKNVMLKTQKLRDSFSKAQSANPQLEEIKK